jgi:hypothetical protein
MGKNYLDVVSGVTTLETAIQTSTGVAQANQIVATGSTGLIDSSLIPVTSPVMPEFISDPVSPAHNSTWVLATPVTLAGSPLGLLLALTQATPVFIYQLSYRTLEGITIRTSLS